MFGRSAPAPLDILPRTNVVTMTEFLLALLDLQSWCQVTGYESNHRRQYGRPGVGVGARSEPWEGWEYPN